MQVYWQRMGADYVGGPQVINASAAPSVFKSPYMFARKVDPSVDAEVVRWWEVLGTLKWGIMCIGQANAHVSGVARSHELAAIGRRVCENEHDLFLALEGRW